MTAAAAPADGAARPRALVTGASRGIGRAVARDLARTHDVIVHGRGGAALDALAAELPGATVWAAGLDGDFTAPDLPRLDVLVHSAGLGDDGTIAGTGRDVWRRVLEVNVVAVAELTRQLLPALRAAEGTVIAVNSGSGMTAYAGDGPYAASKFALRALTDALREEERPHGVRVVSVHPGRTDTDMQRERVAREGHDYDTGLYLAADDVAAAIRTAVDLPHGSVMEQVSVRPLRRRA